MTPIYIQFADNGNIRKWQREPFEGGVAYVPKEVFATHAGWKLVPIEPTEAMCLAWGDSSLPAAEPGARDAGQLLLDACNSLGLPNISRELDRGDAVPQSIALRAIESALRRPDRMREALVGDLYATARNLERYPFESATMAEAGRLAASAIREACARAALQSEPRPEGER